jgi:EmrB/QacA subfamily drug resistance transporter
MSKARITSGAASGRWALASLSLSTLLSSLGASVANVGLPALAQAFGASFQQVQWVVLAYLLAVTTLIVGAGRLGDVLGRRRLLLAGVLLFTAASLLCALAPALWLLIAGRAAQGLGAAVMMTVTLSLVAETVPKERTGGAMGLLGTTSAIGTALGPSLGGVLIAALGWRAMFLALAPLGALALLLAHRHLPRDQRAARGDAPGFDHAGTVLLALTLGAYALATTLGGALEALLGVAVVALALFVLVEARARAPLLRLSTLREPALSGGLATSALVSTVLMTTLVVGPFHLSRALALDPATVGLVMSAGPLVAALTGVPAGRLVDRLGAPRVGVAGLLGVIAGTLALSLTPASLGVAGYVVPLAVVTSGYAAFQAANNTAVMSDRRPDQRGVVAGLLNLSRNLGLVTGASVMGAVFARATAAADVTTASAEAVASATRTTFAVAALVSVVALLISAGARALARCSWTRACVGPRATRLLVVALAVLALGGPATARDEATARVASQVLSDAPIKLGLFYVESAGGEHRLALNGRLMVDARFAGGGDDGQDDGFQVRRGRIDLSGRIAKVVTFKLGLELGRPSGADLRDAYLNLAVVDWLQVRAGQMLVPFSTEGLTSSSYMKLPNSYLVGAGASARPSAIGHTWTCMGWTIPTVSSATNQPPRLR